MDYFLGQDGRQTGPYTAEQIRQMLTAGTARSNDLVWRAGMDAWTPLGQTPEFASSIPTSQPTAPSHPGHPPTYLAPGASAESAPHLAERINRLWAKLIDSGIGMVLMLPGFVWMVIDMVALHESGTPPPAKPDILYVLKTFVGPMTYIGVALSILLFVQTWLLTKRGQSIGKLILKIRIVARDGSPVGFYRAVFLRSFAMHMIGMIPFFGGAITLLDVLLIFRDDRRCLHDMMADTIVTNA